MYTGKASFCAQEIRVMTEPHYYVFSYGSNMLLRRIKRRLENVEVAGIHCLKGYSLGFNKVGRDGSGKANIIQTNNSGDEVWGVIHRMQRSSRVMLDRIEGLRKGYDHARFTGLVSGSSVDFVAYMATEEKYLGSVSPYDWYHEYVLRGALENGFPERYVDRIRAVVPRPDPDPDRAGLHWRDLDGES